MNDDEINGLIARSDEEERLFAEMDAQRDRDAAMNWKAAGNRGKPPPLLIALDELPDCYRTDEPFDVKDESEEAEGRSHRRRAVINYNDGLSDDQWTMVGALLLSVAFSLTNVTTRLWKKAKTSSSYLSRLGSAQARRAAKLESGTGTPMSEGGRGRERKGKAKVNEGDFEPLNGKRKRGGNNKSMSVTPSVMDDEEEDRDSKRRKVKTSEPPTVLKERIKKAFNECYKAIMNCADENGRKRCDLFRKLPDVTPNVVRLRVGALLVHAVLAYELEGSGIPQTSVDSQERGGAGRGDASSSAKIGNEREREREREIS
ncbi:hypothetical protein EDB85DRAFT_1897630 [Lactarius pseudohatsudake]|nr:hypothetical protein EDB85DRAFT_1897630 [Lactarius pseudohatsudake]